MNTKENGQEIELSLKKSLKKASEIRESLEKRKDKLVESYNFTAILLNECKADLYQAQLKEIHIKEIYRLAELHFNRLLRRSNKSLTVDDILELEKWIGRTKTIEGLRVIVTALEGLKKYQPSEIRSNLYGLVQKIIIEGPN